MHLGSKNSEHKYKMHKGDMEIELQPTTLEKDLGVYIDPKLTFSSHCEQKVNKANKILGLIRRSYVHLDTVTVKTLFHVSSQAAPGIRQCVMVSHLQKR